VIFLLLILTKKRVTINELKKSYIKNYDIIFDKKYIKKIDLLHFFSYYIVIFDNFIKCETFDLYFNF